MSDLITRPSSAVAPRLSIRLQGAVHDALNPHPDVGSGIQSMPPAVRKEAEDAYDALRGYLFPADAEDWRKFLLPLVTMVANAPEKDAFERDCRALAFSMPDMPASLFTVDRQREAIRRFKFWPKPAELNDWLGPISFRARMPLHGLKRILEHSPAYARRSPEATR